MNLLNFNSEISKEAKTFDALPEDRYTLAVDEAVVAPTKAGGQMIKITFNVVDGKYKGRKLWHQFPIGEKSNIFLYNFLKTIKSPLISQDGVTLEDVAKSLKGVVLTAWAEPDKTKNGTPTNNLKQFLSIEGSTNNDALPPTSPKRTMFS